VENASLVFKAIALGLVSTSWVIYLFIGG